MLSGVKLCGAYDTRKARHLENQNLLSVEADLGQARSTRGCSLRALSPVSARRKTLIAPVVNCTQRAGTFVGELHHMPLHRGRRERHWPFGAGVGLGGFWGGTRQGFGRGFNQRLVSSSPQTAPHQESGLGDLAMALRIISAAGAGVTANSCGADVREPGRPSK
jgi:hypothetical protein